MRFLVATLAAEASISPEEGLYIRRGAADGIAIAGVPHQLQGALVWAYEIAGADADRLHIAHAMLVGPGERQLYRFTNGTRASPNRFDASRPAIIWQVLAFTGPDPETGQERQIMLPAFGDYVFRFSVDGQEVGSFVMSVWHRTDL